MISSVTLNVLLTALFLATGGCALLRWAAVRAGAARHGGDQVSELFHLLMSLAMLDMVWGHSGATGFGVQIIVFTAFGGYFLIRLVGDRLGRTSPGDRCPAAEFHLLMSSGMVWMVAAMPLFMGAAANADGGRATHDGHPAPQVAVVAESTEAPNPAGRSR